MGAGHAHTLYVHEHSLVHRLPPESKVLAVLVFALSVAVTPRESIWAFLVYAVLLAAIAVLARVQFRFIAIRLIGILPFIAFAFLIPFVASGDQVSVLGVEVSEAGLWGAWNIIAKSTLGATASILLAATTEVPAILRGLTILRFPAVMTVIAGFMIRYAELVVEELRRMRTSMASRGYAPRWIWEAKPIASSAGTLFMRSYERGERVFDAMQSRGFTGAMPVLSVKRATTKDWVLAGSLPIAALIVLLLTRVVS